MEKKKGGRPKKNNKNETWITCRLSVKEKEEIKNSALLLNITVSEYILKSVFKKKIIANKTEMFSAFNNLNTELLRSGNNINQVAKNVNTMLKVGSLDPSIGNVIKVLLEKHLTIKQELQKLQNKILKEMKE